jgi:predicted metal-dependent hydrolase
VITERHYL